MGIRQDIFNPDAFVLQQAGTLGSLGRNVFIGPDLRAFDFSLAKNVPLSSLSESSKLQFRVEFFNLFNRTNFAAPAIVAFAGVTDSEGPLSSFGRTRSTVTSSRQIQFGLRLSFLARISNLIQTSRPSGGLERLYS